MGGPLLLALSIYWCLSFSQLRFPGDFSQIGTIITKSDDILFILISIFFSVDALLPGESAEPGWVVSKKR